MSRVLDHAFENPMKPEEHATTSLAGGIMQHGYQCGMIWGSSLAAGAQAYRHFGPGPEAETKAILAAKRIVESFSSQNKEINCMEITELDNTSTTWEQVYYFLIKGGTIGCLRRSGKYAPVALEVIKSTLSEDNIPIPSSPVSCTARLAQKAGVSDKHVTMASGLAGGIGLCGGACGALGTAIWIHGLKHLEKGNKKVEFKDPHTLAIIEKFMNFSNYEFECSKITGQKFETVEEHAEYLQNGGCSEIIDKLAAEITKTNS